jgi:hypothetical protein
MFPILTTYILYYLGNKRGQANQRKEQSGKCVNMSEEYAYGCETDGDESEDDIYDETQSR